MSISPITVLGLCELRELCERLILSLVWAVLLHKAGGVFTPRLVGSPMMLNQLFESWREWVEVTRRSKDSKKPLGRDSFKGARVI